MKRASIEVVTAGGVLVDHALTMQDEPRGLLVMLPGRGYTCDFPALYYLRKAASEMGYDVLSVRYSFQVAPQTEDQVTIQQLAAEVDQAIQAALRRNYARLIIAGKSLGTPLATRYSEQVERLILLTPIGTAVQDAGATPTLAVIGTSDPVYDPDAINASATNVEWIVLEGLDHGLELAGDWAASLEALRQITEACVEFLK